MDCMSIFGSCQISNSRSSMVPWPPTEKQVMLGIVSTIQVNENPFYNVDAHFEDDIVHLTDKPTNESAADQSRRRSMTESVSESGQKMRWRQIPLRVVSEFLDLEIRERYDSSGVPKFGNTFTVSHDRLGNRKGP